MSMTIGKIEQLVPVKNDSKLHRDSFSKAILNTSEKEYHEFLSRKKKIESTEERLNVLESKLDRILSFLENDNK